MNVYIVVRNNWIIQGDSHNVVHVFATREQAHAAVMRYEVNALSKDWTYSVICKEVTDDRI